MNEIKKELRKDAIFQRENFSYDYIDEASKKIIDKLENLEEYKQAEKIFTYINFNKEVITKNFIDKAIKSGKKVYIPFCKGKGEMNAVEINSLNDLEENSFGILEPKNTINTDSIYDFDMIIVPCVCANKEGYRIGYGGGYYDRFLKKAVGKSVLLCFEKLIYKKIPIEKHDIKTNIVITECDVIKTT